MTEIKKLLISSIAMTLILLPICSTALLNPANAQTLCDNGTIIRSKIALPVILVHGYYEPSNVWSTWEQKLSQDGIPFCTITFHQSPPPRGDECGSAVDHANELAHIVQEVKAMTGQNQVNIVAHSKGGLDARVYLDQSRTHDVANLVMIGTPNAGSPLADLAVQNSLAYTGNPYWAYFEKFWNTQCNPALSDLQTDQDDDNAAQNTNTNYYTIAGYWNPIQPCSGDYMNFNYYADSLGWYILGQANDGIVPISSVESQPYFHNLSEKYRHPSDCHQDLLGNSTYTQAESILLGKQ